MSSVSRAEEKIGHAVRPERESLLMDALEGAVEPATIAAGASGPRRPRIWNFWETALWGLAMFAAMAAGQIIVFGASMLVHGGPFSKTAVIEVASAGRTISLSVLMGLPAMMGVIWLATRWSGTAFGDYLALRRLPVPELLIGVVALVALLGVWELLATVAGYENTPGFMGDVLTSARADH